MAITISLSPLNVDSSANNFVYAIATLTFSGSYVTGGDTLEPVEWRRSCKCWVELGPFHPAYA